jgi:hypothetical protein
MNAVIGYFDGKYVAYLHIFEMPFSNYFIIGKNASI